MAITSDDNKKAETDEPAGSSVEEESSLARGSTEAGQEDPSAKTLGVERYVHAAFLAAGILLAYIAGKLFNSLWSSLADWPAAVRTFPALLRYPEEEREGFTLIAGALVAAVVAIQLFRNHGVRHWADEVAAELAKVTWPNRETVINGTVVVVVATTVGTIYVAILDRFWGFLTTLVYGT